MQEVVDKIRIDLNKSKTRTSISICRGDTLCRCIYITLLNSGTVYEISGNVIATLLAQKPDGRMVYNDCVIQDNEICYTVTNQMIAAAGDVVCQIKLTSDKGEELYTPEFIIRVYEKTFDESILESTNDFSALQQYCIRAEQAAEGIETTANSLKEAVRTVSVECLTAREIADSAVMVRECTGTVIEVKSPYHVVMVTNIKGCTDYGGLPCHDKPLDPVSIGEAGVSICVCSTPDINDAFEVYKMSTGVLRSVGNYTDELCYRNREMYEKNRISMMSLDAGAEIKEVDLYAGTSYEGIRHAYRCQAPDNAIINPNGVWYTCTHFTAETTQLNAAPALDRALQNEPGYFIFTTDMDMTEFCKFIERCSVDILYVMEEADTNHVLNENGIIRWSEEHEKVYVLMASKEDAELERRITVQIPNNAFADAVMQLL